MKISKIDVMLLSALALIGGGAYELWGVGVAALSVGGLLLVLALLMARGAR